MEKRAKIGGTVMVTLGAVALAAAFALPGSAEIIAPLSGDAEAATTGEADASWGRPIGVMGFVLVGAGLLVLGLAAFPPGGRRKRYRREL